MKAISLFLIFLVVAQSFALADSNLSLRLRNPNQIGVIQNYEDLCEEVGLSPVGASINQMCEVVTKSPMCENVPKDDLLQCRTLERNVVSSHLINKWDYLMGCAQGAFTSVKDTLAFLWDVMKWVWNNSTSSEARGQTGAVVSEVSNAAKLYLHTEYQKAYARASAPMKEAKAMMSMNAAIGKLTYDKITDFLQGQSEEFGCLNEEAKARKVCKIAGDFLLPPTGALALIKYGTRGLKQLPKFVNYFKKKPLPVVRSFSELSTQFPNLNLTLSDIKVRMPELRPAITHPREIPFNESDTFRPVKAREMLKRAEELPPAQARTITSVYNTLNDPVVLTKYYEDLFKEAAEWMAKKGRPADISLLRTGRVSKHAIAVVVVRRLKARGDNNFTTIVKNRDGSQRLSYGSQDISLDNPTNVNEFFRAAVKTGPFIDRNFTDKSRTNHGIFTHMIQRDIVHNTVMKETKGNPQKFYGYLGTKKGINWWADLFDSGDQKTMGRPEKVTEFISHVMSESD